MRMKNWKRFAAVAMSVMCMGTMVACGSSGSASNDSTTGSAGSSSKKQLQLYQEKTVPVQEVHLSNCLVSKKKMQAVRK